MQSFTAQPYVTGTQADLSHLLCVSAAAVLQPDPPRRKAWWCAQGFHQPKTTVVQKADERLPELHSPWDKSAVFQVSRCSDASWNMQPYPGWSAPGCSSCIAALCATQMRTLAHHVPHTSPDFVVGVMPIHHTCCSGIHYQYVKPCSSLLLLFPRLEREGQCAIPTPFKMEI